MTRELKYGVFTKPLTVEMLANLMNGKGLRFFLSTSRYELGQEQFDIGISYCFPHIIDVNKFPGVCWFNYHPAPLPKYKGMTCFSDGVRDGVREWGVTLHRMINEVDSGEVVKIRRFGLDSIPSAVNELSNIAHYHLFQLFKETVESLEGLRIN